MISARNRCPFTPNQLQELEHQALIFKYMVSGVPIPSELIYSVKTSSDSSLASRLFPHHHPIGWGCFPVGFSRKADPERGRCRRTDGKKWRCSKEAYLDSKYCEKHMQRGKNRSRKPVEVSSTAAVHATTTPSFSSINRNLPISNSSSCSLLSSSSFSFSPLFPPMASENYTHQNPFLYSHSSTSARAPGSGFFDSGAGNSSSQADKDYSYVHHGTREALDEKSFFPEASGSVRVVPDDSYQPLTVSSYKSYPQSEYQGFGDGASKHRQQQLQEQHFFVLGTDIKSARPIKLEKDEETQKPVHQFFGDWRQKEH